MSATKHITAIQDLFEAWRMLGSRKLRSGVELFGQMPVDDGIAWMHAVFPGCSARQIDAIEHAVGAAMPAALRTFYRCCGGLNLFLGAFRLCALGTAGLVADDAGMQPPDIAALNHQLDVFGWRAPHAIAFAENSWDLSVHVAGLVPGSAKVVRCERVTGAVIEEHEDVFACVADRLYRLDRLLLR